MLRYRTLILSLLLAVSFCLKGSKLFSGGLYILDEFVVFLFVVYAIYRKQELENYPLWRLIFSSFKYVFLGIFLGMLFSCLLNTKYTLPINNLISSLLAFFPKAVSDGIINMVILAPVSILISIVMYYATKGKRVAEKTLDEHLIN